MKLFKTIKHTLEDIIYYLFYPISRIAIIRFKRKNKKIQFANISNKNDPCYLEEQLKKLECYEIFKNRSNSSYFKESDNIG